MTHRATCLAIFIACMTGVALAGAWTKYTNPRYGFSLQVPSTFKAQPASQNGDGVVYRSADAQGEIRAYGTNAVNANLRTEYDASLRRGTITYKVFHGGKFQWFVVSGKTGDGKIFWDKRFAGSGSINGVWIAYPAAQKRQYDGVVAQVDKTFKPGDLDKAH